MKDFWLTEKDQKLIALLLHSEQNEEMIEEMIQDGNLDEEFKDILKDNQQRFPEK